MKPALKSEYHYHTLSNGMRCVCRRHPGASAGYFGVTVRAGSRDEADGEHGLAHFVEHTLFKGTVKRRAWHILNRMEAVGGELNAFTTKEETTVYTAFPAGQLRRAVELVADLVQYSQFPEAELDKERQVVADEIDSYLDQPSEAVYDDFDDMIFAGSSLGHNILGARHDLDHFTGDDCRRWLRQWYTADNMVAFYAGPAMPDRVWNVMEQYLAGIAVSGTAHAVSDLAVNTPFDHHRSIDAHQAHTVIGARIDGMYSESRFTAALVANMLGGPGMNSMLNVSLRERRGLVYTVEAGSTLYTDCGLLSIYYGCDHADSRRCHRLVFDQLRALSEGYINQSRLDRGRRQYMGQLLLSAEHRENTILSATRATLFHGRASDRAELTDNLNAVTPDDVAALGARLVKASTLTLS